MSRAARGGLAEPLQALAQVVRQVVPAQLGAPGLRRAAQRGGCSGAIKAWRNDIISHHTIVQSEGHTA